MLNKFKKNQTDHTETENEDEEEDLAGKKEDGNNKIILFSGIGGLLLIVVMSVYACMPKKGSILYGICSAYLNQTVTYPHTLRHSMVEQYPRAVRIYYTHVDPFGQYKLEMVECSFYMDQEKGIQVDEILQNRKEIDQAIVDEFNVSVGAIVAADPDLTLPPPMPHAIEGLRID